MDRQQYKVLNLGQTKRILGIDEVTLDRIQFHEKLFVFNHEGIKIGRFSMNVELDDEEAQSFFIVHISNAGNLAGVNSISTTTGIVAQNLKTIEEIRNEWSDISHGKQERTLYLLRERTKYYCSVTNKVCDIEVKHHRTIPFLKSTGLIGEAANAILMRSIAIRGYEGILSLNTVLSNGKRCRNYYISRLCEKNVNGLKMQVSTIYRTITNHKKYNLTMIAVLTRAGQMVYLFWSNSKYFLHIDPDLEISGTMVSGERGVCLHRHWNRDIQLYSLYLDRKVKQMAVYNSYVLDRTELRRIVADFVQYVLLLRPIDILGFAIEYFTAFGSFLQQDNIQEHDAGESYEFLGEK